jgi:hypothetical protein
MPGPVPKPDSQRRRRAASASTLRLPASGRSGAVPAWPLPYGSDLELATWRDLWRLPQAVAWESLHVGRVVARYVRALVSAEELGAPASIMAEARQLEDRLGLSAVSLAKLRWEIVDDVEQDDRADVDSPVATDEFSERLRRRAFGAS